MVRYCYERTIDSCPWLAIGAIHFLEKWLKKTDVCLEYGAGQSTVWLGQRVGHIISVESSRAWFDRVHSAIVGFSNIELCLFEANIDLIPGTCVSWDYVDKMKEFSPETFDIIVNDGYARNHIATQALQLLKRGGILVWDDWANIFPTVTHIPGALPSDSIVKDKLVLEFWQTVQDWRQTSFDDGTHSTAIFFKPL
jgi:SAM-dependent methyltransferase